MRRPSQGDAMDRMNPLDASFLYLENGTTHMHIASCAVFEGPPPPTPTWSPCSPRSCRSSRDTASVCASCRWTSAGRSGSTTRDFDLEYHVRHTALPPPGGEADLQRLMGRLMSQELDRSRPLWEAWFVDGLEGDRWAIDQQGPPLHGRRRGRRRPDLASCSTRHRIPSPADSATTGRPARSRRAAASPSTRSPTS